jgi:hypothetical protein
MSVPFGQRTLHGKPKGPALSSIRAFASFDTTACSGGFAVNGVISDFFRIAGEDIKVKRHIQRQLRDFIAGFHVQCALFKGVFELGNHIHFHLHYIGKVSACSSLPPEYGPL